MRRLNSFVWKFNDSDLGLVLFIMFAIGMNFGFLLPNVFLANWSVVFVNVIASFILLMILVGIINGD